MINRVAILISGGGSNMVKLVESMTGDHPARACLVMANDPMAAGLDKAVQMGIPVAAVDHRPFGKNRAAFEAALDAQLEAASPDLICLAGFMRVLTSEFTRKWARRVINIHPSLLPKYKGLHTHRRVLAAKDHEHGCSVHWVTADLDDGPVLGQARVPVLANDTARDLAARVLVQEHLLYPAVLRALCDGADLPINIADKESKNPGI